MSRALDLPEGATVEFTGDQFAAMGIAHNAVAGGLGGFPTGPNADFLILSNGDATKAYAPRPANYPHFGIDLGLEGAKGDQQSFRVTVPVAAGVTHIKFDLNFMTDEFAGPTNEFNDAFSVLATPVGAGSPEVLVQLHVNDDVYLGAAPVNAIYHAQTGALTADYRVPAGATSVVFDFTVADRPVTGGHHGNGDGTGDTAVAVDNFQLISAKQTVWLNFDGGTLTNFPVQGGVVSVPAFQPSDIRSVANRATLINSILTDVAAKYADFDIDFVLTQPPSGNYMALMIGGDSSNPIAIGAGAPPTVIRQYGSNTTVGVVEGSGAFGHMQMDYGKNSPNAVGFSLTKKYSQVPEYAAEDDITLQKRLVVNIAHELGHGFGSPHVDDSFDNNIMAAYWPRSPDGTFEDTSRGVAESLPDGRTALNVHAYLAGILGSSTGSQFVNGAGIAMLRSILNMFQGFGQSFGTLYSTYIGIAKGLADSQSGADRVPQWYSLGDISTAGFQVDIPNLGPDMRISFYGSTVQGGPADFFSGTPTAGDLTYQDSFVPLYDAFGVVNTSVPAATGALGSLTAVAGGVPVSLSKFDTAGLKAIDAKTGFTFQDADGDTVTVKLSAKTGTAAIQLDDPDGDGKGDISRIDLQGTDAKAKLNINVKKGAGAGLVTVGAINAPILGSLNAKAVDLVGAGIKIGGAVKSIVVHDVKNGVNLLTGGTFDAKTSITAHDIADNVTIDSDSQLKLTAARIGDGTIEAAALTKVQVKGDAKAATPIRGDFGSDVTIVPGRTLTAKEAKGNLLGPVMIAGRTRNAHFIVPGNAGAFKTGTFEHSSILLGFVPTLPANPFAGGTFSGDFKLASFAANGFNGLVGPTFDDSDLIASRMGSITLSSVNTANASTPFGIAVKAGVAKHLASIKIKWPSTFVFDPTAPLPQSSADFTIKEI
jgi:hypothetical protein